MPTFGGQSMWGRLNRVILCNPSTAGWSNPSRAARWSELGYWHTLDPTSVASVMKNGQPKDESAVSTVFERRFQ